MNYRDALRFLYSFVSYERKKNWSYSDKTFNLDRFKGFLETLNNPQDSFPSIHVAGSDGKGSVCALVSSVLHSMGYKVGVFSSPHLQNIRERIAINNRWISKRDFCRWAQFLQDVSAEQSPLPQRFVTFFELITAMAFLYFREQQVDFAVIETGLGGRLDTTNVMHPLVTVITRISLEHSEQLGPTLQQIADEKLGITHRDIPTVIGHQERLLLEHFQKRLKRQRAPVIFTDQAYHIVESKRGTKYRNLQIQQVNPSRDIRQVHVPLLGYYQMENTVTALAVLDTLTQAGVIPAPSLSRLDKGFKQAIWPGRFEIIRRRDKPVTVLDVAHTAKGAASLRLSLDEQFVQKKRIVVMGFLQGKKIREMVNHLIRPGDEFIITQAPSPRGALLDEIRESIQGLDRSGCFFDFIKNPSRAFQKAHSRASKKDLICVTGSLYLVGAIRTSMMKEIP